MNTAVICFKGGNSYTREKQLRRVLFEEQEPTAIECTDYDELEQLIPVLYEAGVSNIVLMHEDYNIDRFESVVLSEYEHLFERIEVIPDFSKERLFEDITTFEQSDSTTQNQRSGLATVGEKNVGQSTLLIYPLNPLVKGSKALISRVHDECESLINDKQNSVLFTNVSSLTPDKDGCWNLNASFASSLLGGKAFSVKPAFCRTIGGALSMYPNISEVLGPAYLQNAFMSNSPDPKINYRPFEDYKIASAGVQAFQIGKKIFGEQTKVTIDNKKVEEWMDPKRSNRLAFLVKALGEIQWSVQNYNRDFYAVDGDSFSNEVLKQLGFYKDLETFSKNMRQAGMALVMDAASLIADKVAKSNKTKDGSKMMPIISHPNFDQFASLFETDDNAYSEGVI